MKRVVAAVMLCISAATLPAPVAAQSLSDEWKFAATIYGWFPDIGGHTKFPPRTGGDSISVPVSTILGDLKFVFMGAFEAHKGRWGLFTDIIYMDIGDSKSATRDITVGGITLPAGVTANVNVDLKSWVWTLAGTYRVVADPAVTMDVLAGARLVDVEQTLNYQFTGNIATLPLPGPTGSRDASLSDWDAIVGVKGRYTFGANREWYVPYYLDVGTGQSDLTWQGILGIGYTFKWGELVAAWRYLDYDMKSGKAIEDVNFNGPAIGVTFRW